MSTRRSVTWFLASNGTQPWTRIRCAACLGAGGHHGTVGDMPTWCLCLSCGGAGGYFAP